MFEKIWTRHVVAEGPGGHVLLYVDRHLLHEGTTAAFTRLARSGRRVRRPDLSFATADHYVRTAPGSPVPDDEIRTMVEGLGRHTALQGITYFGVGDPRRGIVHVIGPEQGLTVPGITLVCGDSHTATHGAFGALAFGIGSSEVEHVMVTQTLWQKRPRTMRITVDGRLAPGVDAKDVILAIIAKIGAGGGVGHAIEYAGSGAAWRHALAFWKTQPSDPGAVFDREVALAAGEIAPTVTWGTSPQDALPITARVPDPADVGETGRRESMVRALAYMGLHPGTPLAEIAVNRVFIGSCTNSRLDDLRAAARVAKGRRAVVPAWVVPGSGLIKRAAEQEGLDQIFLEAGFEWRESGCSMCVGMNGETAREGERVASTSNRNFEGRQGKGARTHLMSPAMAAAAAVTGRLTDVRTLRT